MRTSKMTITLVLLIISLIVNLCYTYNTEFEEKFCAQNVDNKKIAEFENCDKYVPKEIVENSDSCLKNMNLKPTYQDFRKAICDNNSKKKYFKCMTDKMKAQKSSQAKTEISEEQAEMFRNHEVCMRKALGIKEES